MIRFERPEAFLLAAPILLALRGRLGNRPLVVALRAAALVAILGALAEPRVAGLDAGRDVVFVVDRSWSASPRHDVAVDEILRAGAAAAREGDRVGLTAFGADVATLAPPTAGFRPSEIGAPVDRDGSDLALAVERAAAAIPPGRPGSLAVFSDGEATGGDVRAAARLLARRGLRLDVYPLRRSGGADVVAEAPSLPAFVHPGEPFQWTAWVRSDVPRRVVVHVLRDGATVAREERDLKPGAERLVFHDRLREPGLRRYEIVVEGADDRTPENDRAIALLRVEGETGVLCLTPEGREDRLTRSLRAAGFRVDVRRPEDAPAAADAWDAWRAVILENVPASKLPRGAAESLRAFVEDLGGGLMMTGGRASFGVGGWRLSPVERTLPVSLEVRREMRRFAMAMAVALDRSGSMAAPVDGGLAKMDLANRGAVAALDSLAPADGFAALAVDVEAHVVAPFGDVSRAGAVRSKILSIESQGGGIYVGRALHAAVAELRDAPQRNRHVVLFADAADAEEPGDYATFLPPLRESGTTVSCIALGSENDPDAALLRSIAELGGGRCFFVSAPEDLPRVFAEETLQATRSGFARRVVVPRPGPDAAELGSLGGGPFPTLDGWSVAYAREDASTALIADGESAAPLLAFRQAGLGRTATFLGEADGEFSGGWATWDRYGDFFAGVVRRLSGTEASGRLFADFTRDGREGVLSIEAEEGAEADLAKAVGRFSGPDGVAVDAIFRRVGARRVEARLPLRGSGAWRAAAVGPDGAVLRTPPLCLPISPEFEPQADPGAGERLLREAAEITGGRVEPPPSELFDGPRRASGATDAALAFLAAALVLTLAEIAARRLELTFPGAARFAARRA
ncbi:MAG TPA: VWA domain-containing protein, partial [Planctomycetota bacterium]|nr:VWA domain-containing protein [Planctomycetota bacterium]